MDSSKQVMSPMIRSQHSQELFYTWVLVDLIFWLQLHTPKSTKISYLGYEHERRSSSAARAVRRAMAHGVSRSNMSNPSRISYIVGMMLVVVVVVMVTRGRDSILWQLLPVHIPTTLLIPMPSSSSYWSSCSSWYRLPLTSTSVTHCATLKTSSFPGLSYAKGIAAVMGETLNHHQTTAFPHLQFVLLLLPIAASCNKITYLPSSISLLFYTFSLSLAAAVPRARIALQICHRVRTWAHEVDGRKAKQSSARGNRTPQYAAIGPRTLAVIKKQG